MEKNCGGSKVSDSEIVLPPWQEAFLSLTCLGVTMVPLSLTQKTNEPPSKVAINFAPGFGCTALVETGVNVAVGRTGGGGTVQEGVGGKVGVSLGGKGVGEGSEV